MTQQDEKIVTISTQELMAMFQMENLRTFVSLYQRLKLVRVDDKNNPLVEALWLRDDFCELLKVSKLPEKFLTVGDVSRLFGIQESQIKYLCRNGFLPYYRLKNTRGSKFFFIYEELKQGSFFEVPLIRSLDYHALSWRFRKYQDLVIGILEQARDNKRLSPRYFDIISSLLLGSSTINALGEKYEMTGEHVTKVFNYHFDEFSKKVVGNFKKLQEVTEDWRRLKEENTYLLKILGDNKTTQEYLSQKSNFSPGFFSTPIADLELDIRTKNCLIFSGIESLDQLLRLDAAYLMKIRNFGEGSLKKLEDYLVSIGVHLEKKS